MWSLCLDGFKTRRPKGARPGDAIRKNAIPRSASAFRPKRFRLEGDRHSIRAENRPVARNRKPSHALAKQYIR